MVTFNQIVLPDDFKERLNVMLTLLRGKIAKYEVDGKQYVLKPSQINANRQSNNK